MARKFYMPYLLIANLVLLFTGLLMPWFNVGFEPRPAGSKLVSGWLYLLSLWNAEIKSLIVHYFDWFWLLYLLEGTGAVLVVAYMLIRIAKLLKGEHPRSSKTLSLAFLVVVVIYMIGELAYRSNLALPGFWLFCLGLVSCAIWEWRNSATAVHGSGAKAGCIR